MSFTLQQILELAAGEFDLINVLNVDDSLLDFMHGKKVFTEESKISIKSQGSVIMRNAKFIECFGKEELSALDELLDYLKYRGDQEKAIRSLTNARQKLVMKDKTTQEPSASANDDFKLSYIQARKVTNVLIADPQIVQSLGVLLFEFVDKADCIEKIKRKISDTDYYSALDSMLENWVATDRATFDKCVEIVRPFAEIAANNLRSKKERIRLVKKSDQSH